MERDGPGRPFDELRDAGLLWLINRLVFHPRGFAFGLVLDTETGQITGWELMGDGRTPWRFEDQADEANYLARAEETFARQEVAKALARLDEERAAVERVQGRLQALRRRGNPEGDTNG